MKLVVSMAMVTALAGVVDAAPWTFEVSPATPTWQRGEKVKVTLTYRNTTKTSKTIQVMSCSWEDHVGKTDPELTWEPWGCDKNAAMPVKLAPGATKSWTLDMFATKTAKPGAHALKLTFQPKGEPAPVASNEVAIEVKP